MAVITSIVVYEDKHEADVTANGSSYRITTADLSKLACIEGECDDDVIEILITCADRLACIKKAFSVLSYGDVSEKRLFRKLSEKFDKDTSAEVAALMKERGYIDEYAAAERFAARFADVKLWGPERIRNELMARGYERDAVNEAVLSLDGDALAENLNALISKKLPASGISDVKIKSKLCAYLKRMGYPYDMINTALGAFSEQGDCFAD